MAKEEFLDFSNRVPEEDDFIVKANEPLVPNIPHGLRLPPRISAVPRSSLLERLEAFLPVLASSNERLGGGSEEAADEANMEIIDENAENVIEFRLGLGVFEGVPGGFEGKLDAARLGKAKLASSDSLSNIKILPSQLKELEVEKQQSTVDPFDSIVRAILDFNSDSESEAELYTGSSSDSESSLLSDGSDAEE